MPAASVALNMPQPNVAPHSSVIVAAMSRARSSSRSAAAFSRRARSSGAVAGHARGRAGRVRRMKLSARNQLAGTVRSVNEGAAIANVEVDVGGQRLVASITVEAARELGLREGAQVTAIVKASDVILATAD